MFTNLSILTAFTVLAVQFCIGEKSCVIWSSFGGLVVNYSASFRIYCTFYHHCRGSMYSDHPPTPQNHRILNSTTTFIDVFNITKNQTYSCKCNSLTMDPCGVDISPGYPPDPPKNISCTYIAMNDTTGVVFCSWNRGRETYLKNTPVLWVRTVFGNNTHKTLSHSVSWNRAVSPSATFTISSSVRFISVWVHTKNELGSVQSAISNHTLSDIEMPSTPVLGHPECSSRQCVLTVEQRMRTHYLEIQYRAEGQLWISQDSGLQMSSEQVTSITSLEPHSLYHFRARSKFSRGLWSQWSSAISVWTQEEAPAKELDLWYAESPPHSLKVFWKEMSISLAKGKIIEYIITVSSVDTHLVSRTNVSADMRNHTVKFCTNCEVTVFARNSKGLSPPAKMTYPYTKAKPKLDMQITTHKHFVTLSWKKPETSPPPTAYVVEWYPEGRKLEELKWARLNRSDNHVVLADIEPFDCYEGAVYVFHGDSSVSKTAFSSVEIKGSVPTVDLSVQASVVDDMVKVNWTGRRRGRSGGCITNYTIYLKDSKGDLKHYFVKASERTFVKRLADGFYNLWVTAWTIQGEGPESQHIWFSIKYENPQTSTVPWIIVLVLVLLCLVFLAVKKRLGTVFQCLSVVPDPANSKWAKEHIDEKGKLNIQFHLSQENITEEEEPILAEIEEMPLQILDETSLCPESEPVTELYPVTSYIKCFSNDSESSEQTQTSLDMHTVVSYISSNEPGNIAEEFEDKEDEFKEMHGFLPRHVVSTESPNFEGTLTLDVVKIDGISFFQIT